MKRVCVILDVNEAVVDSSTLETILNEDLAAYVGIDLVEFYEIEEEPSVKSNESNDITR